MHVEAEGVEPNTVSKNVEPSISPPQSRQQVNLMSLEDAMEKVPEDLRKLLADRLRAEFREVREYRSQ